MSPYDSTRARVFDFMTVLEAYGLNVRSPVLRDLLHEFAAQCFEAGQRDIRGSTSGTTMRAPDPKNAGKYVIHNPEDPDAD